MMTMLRDRTDAGRRLADKLQDYRGRSDTVVLGLARGGVPVAAEIARALDLPLDVFLVRKLGTPRNEELAMGAIASGGIRVLNRDVILSLGIPEAEIERVAAREGRELRRREQAYRGNRKPLSIARKTVILVDDGLATGASMKAAVRAVRAGQAAAVVVAVGTAPPQTVREFSARDDVDRIVTVVIPELFFGVGGSYQDFSQTSDAEVAACLGQGDGAGGS